jgi:hypothetical protein
MAWPLALRGRGGQRQLQDAWRQSAFTKHFVTAVAAVADDNPRCVFGAPRAANISVV